MAVHESGKLGRLARHARAHEGEVRRLKLNQAMRQFGCIAMIPLLKICGTSLFVLKTSMCPRLRACKIRGLPRDSAMSFTLVGLGKLLRALYGTPAQRTSLLREDLRRERDRHNSVEGGSGGDFYVPFWADAKRHVMGLADLRSATPERVAANARRRGLYPRLSRGFLLWWEENRRQRNVPFTLINERVIARLDLPGLGTIKVENVLTFTVGDDGHRIVYPYCCPDPALSDEAARVGIWVMSRCIANYSLHEMRVLDVIVGRSFSSLDVPLTGSEEAILIAGYGGLLEEWLRLRPEYGL